MRQRRKISLLNEMQVPLPIVKEHDRSAQVLDHDVLVSVFVDVVTYQSVVGVTTVEIHPRQRPDIDRKIGRADVESHEVNPRLND